MFNTKKFLSFLVAVLFIAFGQLRAEVIFFEDFNGYTPNVDLAGQGGWYVDPVSDFTFQNINVVDQGNGDYAASGGNVGWASDCISLGGATYSSGQLWVRFTLEQNTTHTSGASFVVNAGITSKTSNWWTQNHLMLQATDKWHLRGSYDFNSGIVSSTNDVIIALLDIDNSTTAMWVNPDGSDFNGASYGSADAVLSDGMFSGGFTHLILNCYNDGNGGAIYDDIIVGTTGADVGFSEYKALKLQVDTVTCEITLLNDTGNNIALNGYSIKSLSGNLESASPAQPDQIGWLTIADNYDSTDGDGSVTGDWVRASEGDSKTDLSEVSLDDSVFADNTMLSLGRAWIQSPAPDLTFEYLLSSGDLVEGTVEFVGGNSFAGDVDNDGNVDFDDLVVLVQNWLESGTNKAQGDVNNDQFTNLQDFSGIASQWLWQRVPFVPVEPGLKKTISDSNNYPSGPSRYNVEWTSSSANSSGSMPLGNGDIGVNAWVQGSDLLFFIGKTDAWSENARLMKLAKVRVSLPSEVFAAGQPFNMTHHVEDGAIRITAGTGDQMINIKLWIDANLPVIHVDMDRDVNFDYKVILEPWRNANRQLTMTPGSMITDNESGSFWSMNPDKTGYNHFGSATIYADTVVSGQSNKITWYHRNADSCWEENWQVQELDPALHSVGSDPLINRTFGGTIKGDGLSSVNDKSLQSPQAQQHSFDVHILTAQTDTATQWLTQLNDQVVQIESTPRQQAWAEHQDWWKQFNDRSYIHVKESDPSSDTKAFEVARGYALQRRISAYAGRGSQPAKFNGTIFVVDNQHDADYRRWGQPYWLQNTRLIYWPMLMGGDVDNLQAFFDMYVDLIDISEAATQEYYGHNGSHFPEAMMFWGGYAARDYGYNRGSLAKGTALQDHIRNYWDGGLEVAAMMLDYYQINRDQQFLTEKLIPYAQAVTTFYDLHYTRDSNGKLIIYPHNSGEEGWNVKNPTPVVAGLIRVLSGLLDLPQSQTTVPQRADWQRFLNEIPDIPMTSSGLIARFEDLAGGHFRNSYWEPEMYPVFPYNLYWTGSASADLQIAVDTFYSIEQVSVGWRQTSIFAAQVGLADVARTYVTSNFTDTSSMRYPAFLGPNYDWIPDQDQGNVAMTGLQRMLLQFDNSGNEVKLFPAWPSEWDVEFKLHGPAQKIYMGSHSQGQVKWLDPTLDGVIDAADLQLLQDNMSYDNGLGYGNVDSLVHGDMDYNGKVDQSDVQAYNLALEVQVTPGDFNLDGEVDGLDLALLLDHWMETVSGGSLVGDIDQDGFVGIEDWYLFKLAYNNSSVRLDFI